MAAGYTQMVRAGIRDGGRWEIRVEYRRDHVRLLGGNGRLRADRCGGLLRRLRTSRTGFARPATCPAWWVLPRDHKERRLKIQHQRRIHLNGSVIIPGRRGALPSLLDHRRFPLFASGQDLVLRPAYLAPNDVVAADDQTQLPAELMRPQLARSVAATLFQNEQLAEVDRCAVPVGSL
jgi:hypothetical protein